MLSGITLGLFFHNPQWLGGYGSWQRRMVRLRQQGRLLKPHDWRRCTLFDINYKPTHMTPAELRSAFHALVTHIDNDEATRWRHAQFREQARHHG